MNKLGIICVCLLNLIACKGPIEESLEDSRRAYCDGDVNKCPELKVAEGSSFDVSSSGTTTVNYGSMTDARDNKIYKTVVIGAQTWMAENLNYGTYLAVAASSSLYQSGAEKFCYGNKTSNCDVEGGLYQWHTAMNFSKDCGNGLKTCNLQISNGNHQGICPSGWHVPNKMDWDTLATELGGTSVAGNKMKLSSFGGDNSSGFWALGVGFRSFDGGFLLQGSYAYFWEAEEKFPSSARSSYLVSAGDSLYRNHNDKRLGFSVRCLKD